MGGLAAAIKMALVGHRVTILEAAPQLAEVSPLTVTSWLIAGRRGNTDLTEFLTAIEAVGSR